MTDEQEILVTSRGRLFRLCKSGVQRSLIGISPERVAKYGVEIHGQEYPIRQVVAKATNTPKIEWTTANAYRILKNLGFEVQIHE